MRKHDGLSPSDIPVSLGVNTQPVTAACADKVHVMIGYTGHLQISCIKYCGWTNPSVLSQVFPAHFRNFHTWFQSTGTLSSGFVQAVWNAEARFIPLFSLPCFLLVDFSFVVCAWKWNIEAQIVLPWYLPPTENAGYPLAMISLSQRMCKCSKCNEWT